MKIDNYNIIDFGLSKIRFSVFDKNLVEKFSETKDVKINENYDNHFHSIIEIIKKAEKKNFFSYKRCNFNYRYI